MSWIPSTLVKPTSLCKFLKRGFLQFESFIRLCFKKMFLFLTILSTGTIWTGGLATGATITGGSEKWFLLAPLFKLSEKVLKIYLGMYLERSWVWSAFRCLQMAFRISWATSTTYKSWPFTRDEPTPFCSSNICSIFWRESNIDIPLA